jgi:hypothetical protein
VLGFKAPRRGLLAVRVAKFSNAHLRFFGATHLTLSIFKRTYIGYLFDLRQTCIAGSQKNQINAPWCQPIMAGVL